MIFNHFLEIYLIICISIILHELAHLSASRIIKLEIKEIHIGDRLFSIHINKVYFSLIMFSNSFVSFDHADLVNKPKKDIVLFFLSGPLANLIILVLAIACNTTGDFYMNILCWVNFYLLILNAFPFFPKGNDMRKLITYLKSQR